jgi:hypothetical protein
MSKLIEMSGLRFGKLVVTAPAGSKYLGRASRAGWWCRCDCGEMIAATGAKLREGKATSCGCRWGWKNAPGRSARTGRGQ